MLQASIVVGERDPAHVPAVELMFSDRLSLIFIREAGKTRGIPVAVVEQLYGEAFIDVLLDNPECWVEAVHVGPLAIDAAAH